MKRIVLLFSLGLLLFLGGCDNHQEPFTVSFDDGFGMIEILNIEKGETVFKEDLEKDGYDFKGWFLDDEPFDFNTEITSNLEIKAKWDMKKYNITFDVDGDLTTVEVNHLNYVGIPKEPNKEGYLFLGWFIDDQPFNFSQKVTSDLTIKAKWDVDIFFLDLFLMTYLNQTLQESILLLNEYEDFLITYESSHPDILSNEGLLKRDYQPTTVTLKATVTNGDLSIEKDYTFNVDGYKSLDGFVRSSYVYRSYFLLDDIHFEILDIINTAFVIADSNGNFPPTSANKAYFGNVKAYVMPKAKQHGVWTVMSIAPESSWSSFASSKEKRENFADNIVSYINEYGFDGVDIDWETPKQGEEMYYFYLMKEVYTKVKENNPNHLVTTAITGGPYQPPRYILPQSGQYIDYINLMTYGMINNGGMYQNALYESNSYTDPINGVGKSLPQVSIEKSIELFNNNYGISSDKIIVGVAFYGIVQDKVDGVWKNNGSITYHEIEAGLASGLYTEYFDTKVKVPYILNATKTMFISYDNPESIKEKARFIEANNIKGMMYWEHHHDKNQTLIKAIDAFMPKD